MKLTVTDWTAAYTRLIQGWNDAWHPVGKVDFDHTWVEACVPYENYRGSNSDDSGYHWIPLDPSFKKMEYHQGDTVPANFAFDYNSYLSKRTHVMPQEALRNQLEVDLGRALNGEGYEGKIVQQEIDVLPNTTPYEVAYFVDFEGASSPEVAALPAGHRNYAEFEVSSSSGQQLVPVLRISMPELVLKRITLSFKAANSGSQTRIDNWRNTPGASMPCSSNTKVVPVFKLDGGDITPAGPRQSVDICPTNNNPFNQLRIHIERSSTKVHEYTYTNIGAHNLHALQVYAFQASEEHIEDRSARLLNAIRITADPNDSDDETLGEYLNIVSLKYMAYIQQSYRVVGRLFGETGDSGNHLGLASTKLKVDYAFELPFAVSGDGMLIDVPGLESRTVDLHTGSINYDGYLLAGYAASSYEAYIWQEYAQLDAVSTVRGLQYANEPGVGIPVVELTSAADVDTKLNGSCPANQSYTNGQKSDVKSNFYSGATKITITKCLIDYESQWLGYVSVVEVNTATTFGTGYLIAGAYHGGFSMNTSSRTGISYNSGNNTGFSGTVAPSVVQDLWVAPNVYVERNFWEYTAETGTGTNTGFNPASTFGGDPVNLISGNLYHPERDLSIKGRGGLGIVFERSYNSNIRKDGPLGYGWTHSLNHQLRFYDEDADGKTDLVLWVDGTGGTNHFTVAGSASGVAINQALIPKPGLYVTAKREANGEYSIQEKNGLTYYFENVAGAPTQPTQTAKLLRIVDRNGNTITLTYSGGNLNTVTDQLGRGLTFYYDDGDQHITRVVDFTGRTYRYSYSNNDLVQVETPLALAGKQAPYTYAYYTATDGTNLDHAMKSFVRPNGNGMTFEYYTNGKVFRHIDSLGQTQTFRYNMYRRETTTVDERGISETFIFNEYGQQIEHWQGDGSRRLYEYADSANPLKATTEENALGYKTINTFNADGDLTTSTLPDGSTLQYLNFTPYHQPTKVVNPGGNATIYIYDPNGNPTEVIVLKKGLGTYTPTPSQILAKTINTYDSYGNLVTQKRVRDFTTDDGPYTHYIYDANDLNVVQIERCGLQRTATGQYAIADRCVLSPVQEYDALGRPTLVARSDWYTQQIEYDANGQVMSVIDPAGNTHLFSRDDNGNVIGKSVLGAGENGQVGILANDTTDYDSLDRPITGRNAVGYATHTAYDEVGNVVRVTNPDGYSVHFEYDEQNRPTRAFDELGRAVSTEYDVGGRPVKITDPNGNSTTRTYFGPEQNGRLQFLTTADGRTLEYFYDSNGNVIKTVDNLGRDTLTEYDALNRPVRSVSPSHYSYDQAINLRQVTVTKYSALGFVEEIQAGFTPNADGSAGNDILAVQASYTYDDFGHVAQETDANGKILERKFDVHGNLTSVTQPNGHVVQFSYDHTKGGLLQQRTARTWLWDASPQLTTYHYNALGQVSKVVSPEVIYTYRYDKAHRLESITDSRGNKTLTYSRSPGGQLNSVADSEGKETDFLYDATGRLTALRTSNGDRVNFTFDAGGRLLETAMSNGVSSRYAYDEANKLLSLENRTSQGIVSQNTYSYDSAGRRKANEETITGFGGAQATKVYEYIYDNIDRLKHVNLGVAPNQTTVESIGYDVYNNRRKRDANSTSYYYQYDNAQQLTSVHTGSDTGPEVASFGYDDNGNLISKSEGGVTRTLAYNALDQLASVAGSDIPTEYYKYDPTGRRIEKRVNGQPERFLYSGRSIWSEYDSDWSQALAHYTYAGLDAPILRATPDPASTRYYHSDGLGSIVATSNANGTVDGLARYDAWGNQAASSGSIPRYGYTGREPDATGFTYYRARYYDPQIGRFLQRDPSGFADGINRYAYVRNSPVSFVDPLGLAAHAASIADSQGSSYAGAGGIWSSVGSAADRAGQWVSNGTTNILNSIKGRTGMGFLELGTGIDALTPIGGMEVGINIYAGFHDPKEDYYDSQNAITKTGFDMGVSINYGTGAGWDIGWDMVEVGYSRTPTGPEVNATVGNVFLDAQASGNANNILDGSWSDKTLKENFSGWSFAVGPDVPGPYTLTGSGSVTNSYTTTDLGKWVLNKFP